MMENEYEEKEQRKVKIDYIKGMYRGSLCFCYSCIHTFVLLQKQGK